MECTAGNKIIGVYASKIEKTQQQVYTADVRRVFERMGVRETKWDRKRLQEKTLDRRSGGDHSDPEITARIPATPY